MCYGWGSETGFFPRYFVVTHRLGKHIRLRERALSGFFVGVRGVQKPGFFRNTSLSPTDLVKTRFLCRSAWGSETGFFPKYFVVTHRLGKKPGFLSECKSRNRVFYSPLHFNSPYQKSRTLHMRSLRKEVSRLYPH